MTIKPIRSDLDLQLAFQRLEAVFQAEEGTAEADERDVLVALIEAYEDRHYAIAQTSHRFGGFGQGDQVPNLTGRAD